MAKRGCGTRKDNGLYICIASSEFGKPIEHFLLDPPKPFIGKPFRTPIIVEGKKVNHIMIYVGKEFYPFVSDYIEECRVQGISRRIPKSFPFERLTPFESRMFFVHERAIPLFEYDTGRDCPRKIKHTHKPDDTCVFDLWHLSALERIKDKHEVSIIDENHAGIQTPSVKYSVNLPRMPPINLDKKAKYMYQTGIFAAFFVSHLEYVNKEKKIPTTLKKRIKETDFDIRACEE